MTALVPPPQRMVIGTTAKGDPVYAAREWYLYWAQGLYERAGGSTGPSTSDISVDIADDAGIEEMRHEFGKAIEAANLRPPSVSFIPSEDASPCELRALIDQLRARIDALEQDRL